MCCNMSALDSSVSILLKVYIIIIVQLLPIASGSIKQGYRLDHVTSASGLYI